jgi:hypothetical protein
MYRIGMTSITCAVLAVALGGSVFATDRVPVVGSWQFEKEVDTLADGTEVSGPAAGYQGFIVLTASGRFVGTILPRDRHWRIETVSAEELRHSIAATDSYFGTYRVDTKSGTLTYTPTGSLDPTIEGIEQVRGYKLSGDRLVLSGSWEYEGTKRHFEITWRRVE